MAPLALVLLYVPCGKLAPGAFRTPPHYDGRRKRSCVLAVSVLVGEFQAAAEESHLAGLAEDPVMKICRVSPRRNVHNHGGAGLPAFFVAFAYPVCDRSAVWRIAEHAIPPQSCFRPSSSGVKCFAHLALLSVLAGSSSK